MARSTFKITLIGDTGTGKSALVNHFQPAYRDEPTIGARFISKQLAVGNENIKLEIWDTAGQERFHELLPMYIRKAQIKLLTYDITNIKTFERLTKKPGSNRESLVDLVKVEETPTFIIGTKLDLLKGNRQVSKKEAQQFADENNFIFLEEINAKDKASVEAVFSEMAAALLEHNKKQVNSAKPTEPEHTMTIAPAKAPYNPRADFRDLGVSAITFFVLLILAAVTMPFWIGPVSGLTGIAAIGAGFGILMGFAIIPMITGAIAHFHYKAQADAVNAAQSQKLLTTGSTVTVARSGVMNGDPVDPVDVPTYERQTSTGLSAATDYIPPVTPARDVPGNNKA